MNNNENFPTPSQAHESNSWRMFRIMGEFAKGFQLTAHLPNSVAIFGSARTAPEHPHYKAAVDVAEAVAKRGFPVITGGGPGIMEAGNKGAKQAGGQSIGLCIELPFEQRGNEYITQEVDFHYFFVRKVMFLKKTAAIIALPGGFGTMDEVFETITLVQTQKIKNMPVILYGREYWGGLVDWITQTMLKDNNYISDGDQNLFTLADSVEEVMQALECITPKSTDKDGPLGFEDNIFEENM